MTYDLERFISAQNSVYENYERALSEIRAGRKRSHWIWYIFPQLEGLGRSSKAKFYGIADLEEARQYLAHPLLGARLKEITEALLALGENNPTRVMGGHPDDMKLRSCMTLFAQISGEGSVFHKVLDKFFGGEQDTETISMLK